MEVIIMDDAGETVASGLLGVILLLLMMGFISGCTVKIPITIEFPPKAVVDYMFPEKHK